MRADVPPLILHVVHSLDTGGTQCALLDLLRSFDRSRFRHAVVTLRDAGALASRLPEDVGCRVLGVKGRSWLAGWILGRHLADRGATIVHARNTGCWFDAVTAGLFSRGTRVALGYHGSDHSTGVRERHLRAARWAIRLGGTLTTVSESGRERLIARNAATAGRIRVLPNGVDTQRFAPANPVQRELARAALNLSPSDLVVGSVASLTAIKRHDLLIQAVRLLAARCPALRLCLVGDGPLRKSLHAQAHEAGVGDRIHWTGLCEDVRRVLPAFDTYVCSSDSEEISNAMLEAAACGLPIVTTDVGDHGRIIRQGREGLLVGTGDADALADAIQILVESSTLRREMGAAARTRAEQFSLARTVQAYEGFYADLLENAARPASFVRPDVLRGHVFG